MRRWVAIVVGLAACGRIGYEPRAGDDGGADDAPPDVVAGCPEGTSPITGGAKVCVEQVERGNATWTNAKATCEGLGRRLCKDAEWATACTDATGLVDMANDGGGADQNWEWVAELETASDAKKRGFAACTDTSSHEIFVDPYDFRCCLDL